MNASLITCARVVLTAPLLALAACAHSPADDPRDPLEPVNRAVYTFNDKAGQYVLKPVARGYVYITPKVVRRGVTNFFDNLFYPTTIINDLLQAKFVQTASDTGRLVLNSTAGLLGLLDVATEVGLTKHNEDFGQTLGYWGVGEGWYLVLPLLGPSDNRDLFGKVGDAATNISFYLPGRDDVYVWSANGLNLINTYASLLSTDDLVHQQFDPYLFVRTAYLQRRQNLIYDGNPPPEPPPKFDDPAPADPAPRK